MKKKIVRLLLVIFLALSIIFPVSSFANDEKISMPIQSTKSGNFKNVIYQDKEEVEDAANYTEEYKKWLELPKEQREKWEVIPRKYKIPISELYKEDIKTKTISDKKSKNDRVVKSSTEEEIPEKFDLRDKIKIPVRNQKEYGLCWDFASLKSLETYLALNGYGDFDLSELHVDYLESEEFGNSRELHDGGNFVDFQEYIANNYGPVLESEVPYNAEYKVDEYEYLLNLEKKVFVNETMCFPNLNKDSNSEDYNPDDVDSYRKKVKEHIMKNGSLYCSIASPDNGSQYFNSDYLAEYYNGDWNALSESRGMHSVSIIGWDDNFPREYFNENMRPEHNGAYIAINSWGEAWGKKGIFYISYEDKLVESDLCGIANASLNNTTEEVQFEDTNLYNEMKEILNEKVIDCNDDTKTIYLSKVAIDGIRLLEITNKNISNLKGIEKFTNLSLIILANNKIDNIECLVNLNQQYMSIDISNNNIKDVSALCNFSHIDISNNPIENGLDKLNNVYSLVANECNLTDIKINQLAQNTNIRFITAQNNKIQNVNILKNTQLETLDLSGNKGINGIEELINMKELILNDCSLDNDFLKKLKNMTKLDYLVLSNNNLTDVSELKGMNIKNLELSGNKGIILDTVPIEIERKITEDEYYNDIGTFLGLENCELDDISALRNTNIGTISLAGNPITDLSPLKDNENIFSIDVSNTGVSDVSPLNKAMEIYLNGNKNLSNLEQMENVNSLYLEGCDINDYSFIERLNKLFQIDLKYNNISEFPKITSEELSLIDLSNNKLKKIPDFTSTKISWLDLSNNEIENILDIENMLNLESDYIWISLSNNKIEQVPEITCQNMQIDVSKNHIANIPENGYQYYKEQELTETYELQINKENRIPLSGILKTEIYKRYKNKTKFITENCTIDLKTGEIIIEPTQLGKGQAKLTIDNKSYKSNGIVLNIYYETRENINLSHLELGDSKYKEAYFDGEEFDDSNLIVKAVYENGLSYIIKDYEIVNRKLTENQENAQIRYQDKIIELPIVVFSKENYDITFSEAIYDVISEKLSMDILYASEDEAERKVRCIIKKEGIDTFTFLDLSEIVFRDADNADYTGLSKLYNLKQLRSSYNAFYNLQNFWGEISELEKLEQLNFNYCSFYGSYEDYKENMNKVLKLPNLQIIDFGKQIQTSHGSIESKIYYLPQYMSQEDQENIKVNFTYKNSNNEYESEDMHIYRDNDNYPYIILDTEINENKIDSRNEYFGSYSRVVHIEILTEKIKQEIDYFYEWNQETEKPTVEIEVRPVLTEGENAFPLQNFETNSNSLEYRFTWSEDVYGFTNDSIIVNNGEKGEFAEVTPNKVYKLIVTNDVAEDEEGTQTISINENACTDLASNKNEEISQTIKIDKKAPTCEITSNIDDLETEGTIKFIIKFSENIKKIKASDFEIENGTIENISDLTTENICEIVVRPENDGKVSAYLPTNKCEDRAQNGNKESNICSVIIDKVKPTVKITGESLSASGENSQQLETNLNNIVYTFTWSEDVKNFTKESIEVEGGEKGEFKEVTSNRVYTLVVTNSVADNSEGTQTIKIIENGCTDVAGNGNEEVVQSIKIDRKAPTCEITANKNSVEADGKIRFTIKFSENIKEIKALDFEIENATIESLTNFENGTYEMVASPKKDGKVNVYLPANKCEDMAQNGNKTSNVCTVVIDTTAPDIKINGDVIVGQKIKIQFEDLSEITGWQITDKENQPNEWNTKITNKEIKYVVVDGTKYIWAKDSFNNISHKAIISKKVSDKIKIKEYTLKDNMIKNVKESTTVSEFLKNVIIENLNYKILNKDNKELKGNDIITTGSKIEINVNNDKINYLISVKGDANNDGHADMRDILTINKHRLNKVKLVNEYFEAGDVNNDNVVDIRDINQINKFRLGKVKVL